MVSAAQASSSRSASVAPAGTDLRRCIYAPPAASAERLTAALATGRAALFFLPSCWIVAQIAVTTIAVFPDRVRKQSRNRQWLAAHL